MAQPAATPASEQVLLGDEAVAVGAVDAGVSSAYAYPGTPSTEILEFLIAHARRHGRPHAAWCANEKTAYEEALGASFAGRRALVSMKHVGLNVAADPFVNSAIVSIHGGVVAAVADDPGMHSSQNEQDSRYLADFARVVCLEPANQQEAYEMTREGFDLSERFHIPVLLRLVTRLAHGRAVVRRGDPRPENPLSRSPDPGSWILLPSIARRRWRELLHVQGDLRRWSEASPHNRLELRNDARGRGEGGRRALGVITTGIARNYYMENLEDLAEPPSHLHVGAYPIPAGLVRRLASRCERILVIEEGYPFLERALRGLLSPPPSLEILGKETGEIPPDGELTPDIVREALGLGARRGVSLPGFELPKRPPQLCRGCPHGDTYAAIRKATEGIEGSMVTSDIGCYTLGALPPYCAIESCVCMGASVGMAKGAAEAGHHPVLAVIGDSTFLHSGVTPLMDAVAADADMTLLILDNGAVAMTGNQPTLLPGSRLRDLILGLGVAPEHFHVLDAHPKRTDENAAVIRREMEHRGLSVVICVRTCLETARKAKKESAGGGKRP